MKGIGNRQNKTQSTKGRKGIFADQLRVKGTKSATYAQQTKRISPSNKRMQGSK